MEFNERGDSDKRRVWAEVTLSSRSLNGRESPLSILNQALPTIVDQIAAMFGKSNTHFVAGYATKQYREKHGVEKDHNLDAAVIAACGSGIKEIDPDYPHCSSSAGMTGRL